MLLSALLAIVTVAFPKEGQKLPAVTQCYAIGATDGGETNLVIQGRSVEVAEGGGWVTMLDVQTGTNAIAIGDRTLHVTVEPPKSILAAVVDKLPKVYSKLPYAADAPRPSPVGRLPGEIVVVLDAGHGGDDSGALSPHGRPEKEANLQLTERVAALLRQHGFQVVLTRTADAAVPLYDRPKVAHRDNADLFVSIHHNAPPCDKDPRTFRYHAVYAWNDLGKALARKINAHMASALGDTLKNNGVCSANFAVTRNPEIPSCLVEADFVTTPEAERDSWDPSRQQKMAAAIAAGIVDWTQTP